jgi:hypothetical protein
VLVKVPSGQFVDLYDSTGIPVGDSVSIHNLCTKNLRIYFSELQPQVTDPYVPLYRGPNGISLPSGIGKVWAYLEDNSTIDAIINVTSDLVGSDTGRALRKYSNQVEPRLLTTTLTQTDAALLEGDVYTAYVEFKDAEEVANGGSVYVGFQVPADKSFSPVSVQVVLSLFGHEYQVIQNPDSITGGTVVTSMNSLVGFPATSSTVITKNPTVVEGSGIVVDPYYTVASGQGTNTQRNASQSGEALRVYLPNESVVVKITNTSGSPQRILFKVSYIESSIRLTP